ncbi:unnamed protein product [Sympodiomycopsis kandeliae]
MERDQDPALNFFPEGEVDLYGALGVQSTSTADEIKKAYRKLALRYHPDKVLSNSSDTSSSSSAHIRFQQLNFAYGVLSDEKRRKRYDETGRTDEPMFMEDGFSWDDYFKEMWQGNVSGSKLDEFKQKYQNSKEEKQDVLEAYNTAKGDLETMFTLIPCSEVLQDEARFVDLIQQAIASGEIDSLPKWKSSVKDEQGRKKMRAKARKEASEAEEYAKELGVWEDLFGNKKQDGSTNGSKRRKPAAVNDDDDDDDDEVEVEGDASSDEQADTADEDEPVQKKRRTKKAPAVSQDSADEDDDSKKTSKKNTKKKAAGPPPKASSSSSSSVKQKGKGKSKAKKQDKEEDAEEGGLDGLRALMMKRGSARNQGFDAMISRLEAQAGGSKKGKGKQHPAMFDDPLRGDDEPDEAAFLAARERIDANKKQSQSDKANKKNKK